MTPLGQKMIEDMQLRGLSKRTQATYVQVVRQLADYYGKSPEQLSEEELRRYFLYLKNEKQVSRSSCTQALCGVKFLYQHTLQREWAVLEFIRPPQEHKLPVVLTIEEVGAILSRVRQPAYRVCLTTIYSCGLRLHEGVQLQVRDIHSQRMRLHVRGGKGALDGSSFAGWRSRASRVWLFWMHQAARCPCPPTIIASKVSACSRPRG